MAKKSIAINLNPDSLIYPYFVKEGRSGKEGIKDFPGVFRFTLGSLLKEISDIRRVGLNRIILFGVPPKKDILGSGAYCQGNIVSRAVEEIKNNFPEMTVITDVCLCAYTSHGHCGVLNSKNEIDPKKTLEALSRIAISYAGAGADWVAPSAMAKMQVSAIRKDLNKGGFEKTRILGYSAKFASNFYAPFRHAADSAPRFADRRAYQLDFYQGRAALREIDDDIREGADMVMVKPALSYLDVIKEARRCFRAPLAAYNVSGEYAMVKYGARIGLWNEKKMVLEIITAIKRAGADFIITYHAKDIAGWIREE